MAQILIRNIDSAVIEKLRLRARCKGNSLEQEARTILSEAASLTRREFSDRAAALRASQRPNKTRAVELIREDRDR
jgi:plasmid stability protein